MTDNDLTNRLRQLDPASAIPADATSQIRKNAMLERVLATPQVTTAGVVDVARPRRFVGRLVVVGAAAAVVAGVLIAHGTAAGSSSEFTSAQLAGWVATPTPKSAGELTSGAKRWCADSTAKQTSSAPSYSNGDQRGAIASMIVTRGAYRDLCLTTGNGQGFWEIIDGPGLALPTLASRGANLQSDSSHGDPATSVNTIWGQVGTGITGLRFHVSGREITATVGSGIWSAWWPASDSFDAPATATVTYTDGTTATVALPQA